MLQTSHRPGAERRIRSHLGGESARSYLLGSLVYSARHPDDLPALAPRALKWYRRLLTLGRIGPFNVVLDLGWLLLDGEQFRFRSYFSDTRLDPAERATREAYEARVLVRRLQERNFERVRRILLDSQDPDLAVTRVLELVLGPACEDLPGLYAVDDPDSLQVDFDRADFVRARDAFESAEEAPGLFLGVLDALADLGPRMDLDRILQDEDFYELQHIRVFPRDSLREVARRIKATERLLGPRRRRSTRVFRERALADTNLESVGTYPTGGIAELTTTGPLDNLVSSELIYLDPNEPVDPFLLRFAENELLRYLRDSTVLRMMRRSVAFVIEECAEFACPLVRGYELHGTKVNRCLMGLVMALTADLMAIFAQDDVDFTLLLVGSPGETAESQAERREVVEVLHLLLREKEEQGAARVEAVEGPFASVVARMRPASGRHLTTVALARPEVIATLDGLRLPDTRVVPVAVHTWERGREVAGLNLVLAEDPLAALREAREAILEGMIG